MGTLNPGTTYIYERAEGVIYSRPIGSDPSERVAIGSAYVADPNSPALDTVDWKDVVVRSETNEPLRSALENAKIIYYLLKQEDGQK
jgi:hypothetical protein